MVVLADGAGAAFASARGRGDLYWNSRGRVRVLKPLQDGPMMFAGRNGLPAELREAEAVA
ncbi:hypothetical protein GCM10010276_32730 [Streptomyces longisporus]|uniref:Uncharacterized protein n=1 Tax=Streptomyces longisporus TaxID=1948 RepID=A0ABP5Z4F3_STRLO